MIDLAVVGGGPAGLATAVLARRAGLTVTVVDRRPEPPIDKACGEGLMPDGVEALARLGIAAGDLRGAPFAGIRYVDGGTVAEGRFPAHPGLGVRRTRLHALLAERAASAGAELRWGTEVTALERLDETTGTSGNTAGAGDFEVVTADGRLAARWVVGADGLLSRTRSWAGLDGRPPRRRRFGVRRHYRVPPAEVPGCVEVWWGDGCEAYVTPVAGDEIGVAVLWWDGAVENAGFDPLLARLPRLAERLDGREVRSRDRGAGPLRQRVRRAVAGNLALVGDAAGYVDAITGEGLSLAFQQAAVLIEALAAGDLARYETARRRLARLPDAMTRLLLFVERRPALRRRTVRALAADPALFSRLLALHVRDLPLTRFGLTGAARLAWRLAAA
ncbi:MAG TPA: NAD(P)/FAD-dependent oxidoreductase [Thermoanaerobaculia bacterium]|nr:NAD(P)/FAD-dependent oxidoreductase [Thermoanaerobaculia bacterium]